MPVNTAALKTFAPAMRRQLLEAVGRKLDLLLNSQTPDTLSTYSKQIAELREQEAENREQLLERVAYTWFNRLCALRYLDAKGWHPFGCKVLMPAAEGETQPELLKLMRASSLPSELRSHTNEARLHGLLDGQIPPVMAGSDPQGEVYRELMLASCRSYHQLLPDLFEELDDASELLLPDDLLSEGSIAGGFRTAITDADCEDVEIIGWLYQFYISEKKDQVIGKVVHSEDIPAATQLFTPNWIVKYMVQNSLGATWVATYPDSTLKGEMEFYIQPAEQTVEVQSELASVTPPSLAPEALTLLDPACGSGHILLEAYDLLKSIYLERGYRLRDIPEQILTKNLYGLDICPRAVQMATFCLLMKGREDNRRLLEGNIQLNIAALANSSGIDVALLANAINLANYDLSLEGLIELKELFLNATTFGSLIRVPDRMALSLPKLSSLCELRGQGVLAEKELGKLKVQVRQAELLSRCYISVVANPPYMGSKYLTPALKTYLRNNYEGADKDCFSAFITRALDLCDPAGSIGIVAPFVWMFLSSFELFRESLISRSSITSLVQLEYNAFEPACIPVATFVAKRKKVAGITGTYISLSEFKGHQSQAPKLLEAIRNPNCGWLYIESADEFRKIPSCPIAFSASRQLRNAFAEMPKLKASCPAKVGLQTGDNELFVRYWSEIDAGKIGFHCRSRDQAQSSKAKWFPYTKGGQFRKWYGNNDSVLNWLDDGAEIRSHPSSVIRNNEFYFKEGITFTKISSTYFGARATPYGFIFDQSGSMLFPTDGNAAEAHLAFVLSNVADMMLGLLNPTMAFNAGTLGELPHARLDSDKKSRIVANASELVQATRADWDAYVRSWDFKFSPLLSASFDSAFTLESKYAGWINANKVVIRKMQLLEEENNRLFIEAYGLDEEVDFKVPLEQITLTSNPAYRYGGSLSEAEQWNRFRRDSVAEFLYYATSCMMGRYCLSHPGLILAESRVSQADQLAAYEQIVGKPLSEVMFKPDPDGIIPVLEGEWFEDDIVARTREFLAVTFPESSVGENLRFIEESLGKDIRKYFCTEFYKDHLQTYKKRPIYWMVQSPKKGFACLIYLHRYTKDTLNQVLNNYFRPYLQKLEARLAQLEQDQINDDLKPRDRTAARKEAEKITKVLKECQAWEQDALLPLAQQRIPLDLDDGVKVNYLKLQDVLATIPGLAAKED